MELAVKGRSVDVSAELNRLPTVADTTAVVCAGDLIETDTEEGFLRGHGTQPSAEDLRATQCGVIRRVNKLVSVSALRQRYVAEIGDVVVGRVVEIAAKRWKVELQSSQEASLLLSAITLPGDVQRRRTVEDELNMRAVYQEGDLLSAEVQTVHNDGGVALKTRGTKYGKLQGGQLVSVPSILVPRQKQHFATVERTGVSLILGVNGLIWVSWGDVTAESPAALPKEIHESIARTANVIKVLAQLSFSMTPARISRIYWGTVEANISISAILHEQSLSSVCALEKQYRKTSLA